MQLDKFEKLIARILFVYVDEGETRGREIMYAYNRQSIEPLKLKRDKYFNSQFIDVGDILTLEGFKCKVVRINYMLDSALHEMSPGDGVNSLSPTEPTDYNCQINIFVERIS